MPGTAGAPYIPAHLRKPGSLAAIRVRTLNNRESPLLRLPSSAHDTTIKPHQPRLRIGLWCDNSRLDDRCRPPHFFELSLLCYSFFGSLDSDSKLDGNRCEPGVGDGLRGSDGPSFGTCSSASIRSASDETLRSAESAIVRANFRPPSLDQSNTKASNTHDAADGKAGIPL